MPGLAHLLGVSAPARVARPWEGAHGQVTPTEEFVEFAAAASARLRRTAFLLCGDWHTAEDLAQATLAKLFVSWRRISRRDAAYAYATRTLVNTYLADRRTRRAGELLTDRLPERAAEQQAPELRIVVLGALAMLPPRARAVVVLRYWADMSVEQVAAVLGCSPGNVKSQSARALDRLRPLLGDAAAEFGLPGHPLEERRETRSDRHG
jgi:RNA polymerase sigma-70 factor (sigma-E family)